MLIFLNLEDYQNKNGFESQSYKKDCQFCNKEFFYKRKLSKISEIIFFSVSSFIEFKEELIFNYDENGIPSSEKESKIIN